MYEIRLLAAQSKWIELEKKIRSVSTDDPNVIECLSLLSYSFLQQGRFIEAIATANQAIEIYSNIWMANLVAGIAFSELGQAHDACKYLRRAATIKPNEPQTIAYLVKAITVSEGIELAASEYAIHCNQINRKKEGIFVASISTVRDCEKKTWLSLREAGKVEEIPFKAPHVFGSHLATDTVFALSNKPYVAEIENARIFSNSSLIIASDGTALSDTGGHPRFGRYVSFVYEAVVVAQQPDKVLLDYSRFNTREIEAGIFLSGLGASAFGHWLPEFLPKLQFLQQHPDFEHLPIIVDAGMPQSHFDHLRRFVSNPLLQLQANESFLCKRLLVSPSPTFFPFELLTNDIPVHEMPGLSLRALRFLRAGESYEIKKPRHRRIFLARKNMKWRRLLNEEEIAATLLNLSFETVYLEEMTVSEQIDLVRQAQWIVAPNGSALLNLIFADTSTKLLVLSQPNLHNWGTFQGPMDSLGYQSLFVCGDYAVAEDEKHSDYHVPVQRIREALSYMGMTEALI